MNSSAGMEVLRLAEDPGDAAAIMRRATVFVADLDRSVRFYQGVFGLGVYHERTAPVVKDGPFPIGEPGRGGSVHFTILRGPDPMIGMIGLLCYDDPPLSRAAEGAPPRLDIGSVALVFQTPDARKAAAQVEALGGRLLMEPKEQENTGDETGARIPTVAFFATDPDGYVLEVFERRPG